MGNSPGRVARPISVVMALLLCGAALVALAVGITQRGEQGMVGLQSAFTLAILSVLWVLIGIMYTVAKPQRQDGPQQPPQHESITPEEPPVNWFQDAKAGAGRRRR